MRLGEVRIQSERALRRGTGFFGGLFYFFSRHKAVVGAKIQGGRRQLGVGERVTRVEPDRLLIVADRFAVILGDAAIKVEIPL